ncbi:mitochondrial ferredoxin [Andalucia godoyi]|uniref:Mitochondrial ferredoxin n=1 Tax=Andalucia godoyi TaxID=505711 RepID=A0A8K0F201_ANDGO|nr:mitochondrial ferredoxin [Andalucia godoyi]|eukprot:ANDGO_08101.mRNA.1 mitochondrial ferredoxin
MLRQVFRLTMAPTTTMATTIMRMRRSCHAVPVRRFSSVARGVSITFCDKSGSRKTVVCKPGESLLEIAHANEVDLEGACEGSLACSTCHVILEQSVYDKLEEPSDEENDMLDLAFGLTETSRLGCQVRVTNDMDGMVVRLPSATRNMAVDGYVPKPH